MKRTFRVLPVEASEGIERLCDPIPRHLYRPGQVVELDDSTCDVAGIMAGGQIEEIVLDPLPPEPKPASKKTDVA